MTKVKSIFFASVAVAISFLLCVVVSEAAFSLLLFKGGTLTERLRKPQLYADSAFDDDYWKLLYRFGGKGLAPREPHPILGWTSYADFSRETYLHHDSAKVGKRRPVLLYGDSFAYYIKYKEHSVHTTLNHDLKFNPDHYLLNYGVGGYGFDQIFLLFRHTIDLYSNPFVIMSFLTDDLDRCLLSVRGGQKPYFELVNGELKLKGVPIDPDPADYFANHPAHITSYLYRMLIHSQYLPRKLGASLRGDESKRTRVMELGLKILNEMVKELKQRKLEYVFLIFFPQWPGDITAEGAVDWHEQFLRRFFQENQIPCIFTRDIVSRDASRTGKNFADYYLIGDGHPTPYQNRLISEEILNAVLKAGN